MRTIWTVFASNTFATNGKCISKECSSCSFSILFTKCNRFLWCKALSKFPDIIALPKCCIMLVTRVCASGRGVGERDRGSGLWIRGDYYGEQRRCQRGVVLLVEQHKLEKLHIVANVWLSMKSLFTSVCNLLAYWMITWRIICITQHLTTGLHGVWVERNSWLLCTHSSNSFIVQPKKIPNKTSSTINHRKEPCLKQKHHS